MHQLIFLRSYLVRMSCRLAIGHLDVEISIAFCFFRKGQADKLNLARDIPWYSGHSVLSKAAGTKVKH